MRRFLLFCLIFLGLAGFSAGTAQADYGERFDTAWELVSERYWDTNYGGADWPALRRTYRPHALAARNDQAF